MVVGAAKRSKAFIRAFTRTCGSLNSRQDRACDSSAPLLAAHFNGQQLLLQIESSRSCEASQFSA